MIYKLNNAGVLFNGKTPLHDISPDLSFAFRRLQVFSYL